MSVDPTDGRKSAAARGYDADWRRLQAEHLAAHPWCADCLVEGKQVAGELVDHVIPISHRPDLRLDRGNLKTQCRSHHQRKTMRDIHATRYWSKWRKRNARE